LLEVKEHEMLRHFLTVTCATNRLCKGMSRGRRRRQATVADLDDGLEDWMAAPGELLSID
jgi:hypothetical protein